MNSKEIGILSNMSTLLYSFKIKKIYNEEDYSDIYKLIDGYRHLKKYFYNYDAIEDILNIEIKKHKLFDLVRITRNRLEHIDKNNAEENLVLLLTEAKPELINKLIVEISNGINNIVENYLNNDLYKLIMNNRHTINLFALVDYAINIRTPMNKFDANCRTDLQEMLSNFDYRNSNREDFDNFEQNILNYYNRQDIKKGIIDTYNEDIYNDILRMMTDDSFDDDDVKKLFEKIKKESK